MHFKSSLLALAAMVLSVHAVEYHDLNKAADPSKVLIIDKIVPTVPTFQTIPTVKSIPFVPNVQTTTATKPFIYRYPALGYPRIIYPAFYPVYYPTADVARPATTVTRPIRLAPRVEHEKDEEDKNAGQEKYMYPPYWHSHHW
ncbi:hypothetical protein BG011_009320 [Mortierella polycephala]|uniref:Uncharacterized protein n=1 Tax=Mortierella polycephala TaxID=41804 RepID=A0A9P6PLI7_9FUNG|nr:hypothetical protein BG011_009320 [Mortierella polycephala]